MKNAKVAIIDGFHVVALGTECDAGAEPLAKANKQEWMSRSRVFAGLSWHCQGPGSELAETSDDFVRSPCVVAEFAYNARACQS